MEDVLMALGEKTAENFILRRENSRLTQELGELHARLAAEAEVRMAQMEQRSGHAQPEPQREVIDGLA